MEQKLSATQAPGPLASAPEASAKIAGEASALSEPNAALIVALHEIAIGAEVLADQLANALPARRIQVCAERALRRAGVEPETQSAKLAAVEVARNRCAS